MRTQLEGAGSICSCYVGRQSWHFCPLSHFLSPRMGRARNVTFIDHHCIRHGNRTTGHIPWTATLCNLWLTRATSPVLPNYQGLRARSRKSKMPMILPDVETEMRHGGQTSNSMGGSHLMAKTILNMSRVMVYSCVRTTRSGLINTLSLLGSSPT